MPSRDIVKDANLTCFCRNCHKIVVAIRHGKGYSCPECKEDSIMFGTEKTIKEHYNLK